MARLDGPSRNCVGAHGWSCGSMVRRAPRADARELHTRGADPVGPAVAPGHDNGHLPGCPRAATNARVPRTVSFAFALAASVSQVACEATGVDELRASRRDGERLAQRVGSPP